MPRKTTRVKPAEKPSASPAPRIPLRITDTTLRDAHQSLWATRMRSEDILKIIDVIDNVGFYSLEVWGGATFDVALRFLREDPWERLRAVKAKAKKTPLQMLLRGQNILGYKNYPDDVLDHFVALAVANGIDIFRIFDALNDTRNLEYAIKAVKKYGGHAQGTICYTVSPVHTVEEFVRIAKEQIAMGIDSLCIKDMAGILSPFAAERLVSALVRETKIPIQIHSHMTSGMAVASYVEGVRAGAGAIDCAISPMAGFSSQPPVETMLAIFEDTPYQVRLDMDALKAMRKYFQELAPKRRLRHHQFENIIDPDVLLHHIPGGMISNLRSQLAQQGALDKLEEVFEELPRVRADLGYPPLVTPTSQLIGIQAVMNVLAGERYEMVSQEVKDYVRGLYGRPPAPINPEVRRKILGDEPVIETRPADSLPPMLPTATQGIDPSLIKSEEDIISYCLFPEPALEYFKWRSLPPDKRPPPPADLELEKEKERKNVPTEAAATETAPRPFLAPSDYAALHELLKKVRELGLTELSIRRDDLALVLRADGMATHKESASAKATSAQPASSAVSPPPTVTPPTAEAATPKPAAPESTGLTINSPLSGNFYRTPAPGKPPLAQEGDTLKADDPVCIVEAMKLFNTIKAPFPCRIIKFLVEHGQPVKKDAPLVEVERI